LTPGSCRHCGCRRAAAGKPFRTNSPAYYNTSDAGLQGTRTLCLVDGRTDDIINVAGHRLSTAHRHGETPGFASRLAECACSHQGTRSRARCRAVFLAKAVVTRILPRSKRDRAPGARRNSFPCPRFHLAITLGRLPKTRSGKILRRAPSEYRRRRNGRCPHHRGSQVLDEICDALKGGCKLPALE